MENTDGKKLDTQELNEVAGGGYYDCDWLVTCASCKSQFVIHGYQQMVYCQECLNPIYLVHGEGNPHKIDQDNKS